jgi:uncharacterized protein YndB with AHSA1/START domain
MDRTVSTSRLVAATPAAILAAFIDGARLARWWGPAGFSNTFEIFEPRPGGRWNFVMHGPDGAAYPNQSVVDEVGSGRIVVRHLSPPRFSLTIGLETQGTGTRLTWTQEFESAEVAAGLRALVVPANEQNLDRLEAELRGAR